VTGVHILNIDWKDDIYLRKISQHMDEYDIFSFDVFDTLLFRTCDEPGDVFETVGEKLIERLNGWPYSPTTYKTLRREAEHRARARKPVDVDCTFDEIMSEMPFDEETLAIIRRTEIESEKQAQYLNENTYALMRDCVHHDRVIVIVSDMYHSRRQIMGFLGSAGVDTNLISDCFVSSEQGCFKAGGGLFRKMLTVFAECDPSRVLHIGDNMKSDIEGAKKAGMHALLYPTIPRDFGSIYDFERYAFGVNFGKLNSLRKLAAVACSQSSRDDGNFFFAFGAEVIGPLYALFADWVIQYAERRGIGIILPFMREGELLARVVSRACDARGANILCEPLYVSRQPAFIAGIYAHNFNECISRTLLRGGRSLRILFEELGLGISQSKFAKNAERTLESLKSDGKISEVETYLQTNESRETILSYASEQRRLMLRYMKQMMKGRHTLTLDIGTKGTTERCLHDICTTEGNMPPLSHALMMGSMTSNADNILDGMDITAWLGIAGENGRIISKIMYQVMVAETLLNATCGSVLRYCERDGEVMPIQESETASDQQKRKVSACWRGIEKFQTYWLDLSAKKNELREEVIGKKKDFLNILLRFIDMPTKKEAELIGSLRYFDGFNNAQPTELSDLSATLGLKDSSAKHYITAELTKGNYWPQANIALHAPAYFHRALLNNLYDDPTLNAMLEIIDEIKSRHYETGVIFGASELGRKFCKLAVTLNLSIVCFIDSNKRLHGTAADGVKIRSLYEMRGHVDYFVIASYVYAKEMRTILEAYYSDERQRPMIFDLGMRNC
jgi:FMN phosphatase YigB (HAD superfamily)